MNSCNVAVQEQWCGWVGVDFLDDTALKLATAAGRAALLDQATLGQMAEAAFDTATAAIEGPFAVHVETLDLGLEIARPALVEGTIRTAPGIPPAELRLRVDGLAATPPLLVDALWRGSLIARSTPQDDLVTGVGGSFTLLDLDRAVIAELGALPGSAPALEAARRAQLLARLRAGAAEPASMRSADLDHMLEAAGAADVGTVLAARGAIGLGAFRLSFSAAAPVVPPVPVSLPVTVAVLVRDAPLHLSALLAESRSVRTALASDPAVQPVAAPLRRRTPILVLWAVPATLLDDPAWPGADRAARRAAAAELLQGQGIALAAV